MQNEPDLDSYDAVVVAFSGGKDSIACVLHLLERGVPLERIELWHHDVDGREGSDLMDWPVTRPYCQAFADAMGLRLFFSWKEGGFEREMLRDQARTAPTRWEGPDGASGQSGGTAGKLGTRRKFPQVSADLSVRWCSAYLKIDVGSAAVRGQARFHGQRILMVSGERAEESTARAKYATFEPDRADLRHGKKTRRHVDRWRPVHAWPEREIWAIMKRWRVRPHPAYELGFGRVSCMFCIFGNADQFATARACSPDRFDRLGSYEREFGLTVKRKVSLPQLADAGTPYADATRERIDRAMAHGYDEPILERSWRLPAGAFGDSAGPS
jgi:3'-phosphoadenosine 5'-phosphosulfate sulfotransferase (PAPS reductase)/FAD synthetase